MSKLGKIYYLLACLSLVCFGIMRFLIGGWVPFLWICLGLTIGFLSGAVWQDRSFYKEFFTLKTTKQGMSMGALFSMVLIILIGINFIAVRKYKSFDFSTAKVNTLSDQSKKLMGGLDSDLLVIYFYQKGAEGVEENRRAFIELLKKYQDESPFVKLQFVDVNERPDLTEKYGVNKGSGVVFLDYKGRTNKIDKIDEQELTSALVKVTREKEKIVYFTSGHGERDMADAKEPTGLFALKALLEGNRYIVKVWGWGQNGEIPTDADLVISVAPTQAFLDRELEFLSQYLKRGGSLVLALEPNTKHGLQKLLGQIGIDIKNNYLVNYVDTKIGRAVNPQVTIGSVFSPSHQITKPMGKNQFTVFRLPMALEKADKAPGELKLEPLVKTAEATLAYPTTEFKSDKGTPGVFTIAMAIQGPFNAVVFGDADFLSNQLLYQNLNRDLLLNSLAFLTKEENLISITPKEVGVTEMQMSESSFYFFVFTFILGLPLALLVTSGTLWFRRRHA